MNIRHLRVGALCSLVWGCVVAGCSSSVGNPVPSYGSTATNAPIATATVAFTVLPQAQTTTNGRTRKPEYVSSGTLSVSIVPIITGSPNQKPTVINIGAGMTGCTGSGATLACTGDVIAPVGETSFTVETFAGTNGQGAGLSVGTITVDVKAPSTTATISNATSLTLGGIPASFAINITPQTLTPGTPETISAVVTSFDGTGAIIVGPGSYTTAIDLETIVPSSTGNDTVLTSHVASLSEFVPGCMVQTAAGLSCHIITVATGPAQTLALAYSGEFLAASSITLAGESPGLATQQVVIPFVSPTPIPTNSAGMPIGTPAPSCAGSPIVVCPGAIQFQDVNSTPVPVTVSEPGVTTFQGSTATCTIGGASIAFIDNAETVNGTSFTVEPGTTAGACYLLFTDAANNSTELQIDNVNGAPSPTPSPSPTIAATATPIPVGPITISPSNSLVFTSSTAPPQTFTTSENGVSSFTIDQSQCAGIANASPTQGASFTVTPVSTLTQGGSCTLTVRDPSGQTSAVGISIDGVSFVINKR